MNFLYDHQSIEPISDIFIRIGTFEWQKYSFMILLGIAIAVFLGIREGNKLGIRTNDIVDGILIIVPLSIIGTRLWYVLFEWQNKYWPTFLEEGFVDGIINVFDISSGGLAIHGGFITAFISAYVYTKIKKINFFSAFDIMVPGFLIAQASGRWGNFFNQEAHGGVIGGTNAINTPVLDVDAQRVFLTDTLHLPDWIANQMYNPPGAEFANNYYHPTFLYESVWNVIGFIIVLFIRRTKWVKNGELLAFYLIWYSFGRFFIEGMRTDSLYVGSTGLRTAQVISILMILGGIAYVAVSRLIWKNKNYHEVLEETALIKAVVDTVSLPTEVSENITLPQSKDGYEFVWESPKKHIIKSNGVINQKQKDQNGLLTVTAYKDDLKVSKNFKIIVKAK